MENNNYAENEYENENENEIPSIPSCRCCVAQPCGRIGWYDYLPVNQILIMVSCWNVCVCVVSYSSRLY